MIGTFFIRQLKEAKFGTTLYKPEMMDIQEIYFPLKDRFFIFTLTVCI
jgi:hypothetical protein